MSLAKKFITVAVAFCLLLMVSLPLAAQDNTEAKIKKTLRTYTPSRHRYLFSVVGGAALGAGVGAILGSGNDLTKGALIGAGGMSDMYLTSFRNAGGAYRGWAYILSNTALGAGVGWTLCGCNRGLEAGTLIGGGGTAALHAWNTQKRRTTATSTPAPTRP